MNSTDIIIGTLSGILIAFGLIYIYQQVEHPLPDPHVCPFLIGHEEDNYWFKAEGNQRCMCMPDYEGKHKK